MQVERRPHQLSDAVAGGPDAASMPKVATTSQSRRGGRLGEELGLLLYLSGTGEERRRGAGRMGQIGFGELRSYKKEFNCA